MGLAQVSELRFGRITVAGLVVLLGSLVATSALSGTRSDDIFRRALENRSTASSFVLFTLVSTDGRTRRQVAIPAPFLLGAIHREHHIPSTAAGQAAALKIALEQPERTFQFKDRAAVRNVQPRYTEKQLAAMRERLKDESQWGLRTGFNAGSGRLDSLYNRPNFREYSALRDAIAHVVIERGLLAGHGDIAGFLTVKQ